MVRKPAALGEAVRTRLQSAAPMAAPGAFLVPVLLFLCGPAPYPAAVHSHSGKGAHGKATGPFCGWGWGMELPVMAAEDRMWDCVCAGALLCRTSGVAESLMCPRTGGIYMAPCSGAARRVRLYQEALLGVVLGPTAVLEHLRPH